MTYEIEFIDETGAHPASEPRRRADSRPQIALAVATLGWVVAAAMVADAPLHTVYGLTASQPEGSDSSGPDLVFSIDGWGRQHISNGTIEGHGARFGIGLCVCGVLFVLLAGFCVVLYHRPCQATERSTLRRVAAGFCIGATALLAGVIGAVYLDTKAAVDSYANFAAGGDPTQPVLHARYGSFLWLSAVALACALVAAGALAVAARGAHQHTPVAPLHDEDPGTHDPEAEQLR
ncbi:MAG: hypothetical protein ACRDWT_13080 [Jatrophihabitantaceae bacterium]